ncbi:MAG TPA: ROK family transcriptional regulator [Clostridiaceae bacterium]|nr:ROK family transcriptional regulator [Clostridiaceae bacterium]
MKEVYKQVIISCPSMVGDNNKFTILKLIKNSNGISRQDISRTLKLSAPAVSKNVAALISAGIIREEGTDETRLGRKPVLLKYNSNLMYVLGIEIMPRGLRGAISDLCGNVISQYNVPSDIEKGTNGVLVRLRELIEFLLEKKPEGGDVTTAGIAVPGLTDKKIDFNLISTFIDEWNAVDVKSYVEDNFKISAIVMNDVELDLIGECWIGAGKDYNNILLVKYGDGFAARSMINGMLLTGANRAAGEIGYYLPSINDVRQSFFSPGVTENKLCREVLKQYGADSKRKISFSELLKKADEGDATACSIVEKVVDDLAVIINNIVLVIDPEVVILGSEAAFLRDQDINRIKDILCKTSPAVPEIRVSQLRENAGVMGGIKVAITSAEENLINYWK